MPSKLKPVRAPVSYAWTYRRAFRRHLGYDRHVKSMRKAVLAAFKDGGAAGAAEAIAMNAGGLPEPRASRVFRAQFQYQSTQHFQRFISAMPQAAKKALGIVGPNSASSEAGLETLRRMRLSSAATVENAVARNLSNGRAVFGRYANRLADGLARLQEDGKLTRKTLSKLLVRSRKTGLSEIAFHGRDEAETVNGRYTRDRSQTVNANTYEWGTQGDDRVRPSHAELAGMIFAFGSPPPSLGLEPGQDHNCRCYAQTIFSAEDDQQLAAATRGPPADIVSIHVAWRGYLRELSRLDRLAA